MFSVAIDVVMESADGVSNRVVGTFGTPHVVQIQLMNIDKCDILIRVFILFYSYCTCKTHFESVTYM